MSVFELILGPLWGPKKRRSGGPFFQGFSGWLQMAYLGPIWAHLRALWRPLGPVLAPSWPHLGHLGPFWAPSLGHFGHHLGTMLALICLQSHVSSPSPVTRFIPVPSHTVHPSPQSENLLGPSWLPGNRSWNALGASGEPFGSLSDVLGHGQGTLGEPCGSLVKASLQGSWKPPGCL